MIIYGTAILAICHLLGDYLGNTLGMVLGVKANVGGVAISMILLILSKELLAKKGYLPQVTQFGVLYWSGMYIPIVVAMSAGQNVVAALSGGMLGLIVSIASLIGTVLVIRYLNRISGDYETYEWTIESKEKIA
ncbi:malonate transporter subunit MadL [Acinetobacter pittii]|jgi:malonate transporter MadL subunit|uniref:Malonate transporter, MadL subunit n=4 Tax=Acinetobacter TaxID=469 RepID=F0KLI3_ACIP2|nr:MULTISPECIES: malonate transporter subunit MadL [Acinetobacter]YP_004995081.1 malonate transporter subunit MadL [Acinetobacter pittii PHEA-2]KCY64409.1 malonate transporter, MadL subunit [Acinetobacter baumannii 1288284]ADY81399.1 malonate transporter, MadL subunit [Acinetobacter pittii PHEA-2]AUT34650.1 malonate transporter subunit MadL [Acinetobacter pittii]AVN18613.1 malonate transporter subunit MadL [Acinetobacter pittii]AVN22284.1 malonate transporter subunit MadL [Acinetobacter pitti